MPITILLEYEKAQALAEVVKRFGFDHYRAVTRSENEAYAAMDAAADLLKELRLSGIDPR
jgi:hypothetical protein